VEISRHSNSSGQRYNLQYHLYPFGLSQPKVVTLAQINDYFLRIASSQTAFHALSVKLSYFHFVLILFVFASMVIDNFVFHGFSSPLS
jgi:hypothetical protein